MFIQADERHDKVLFSVSLTTISESGSQVLQPAVNMVYFTLCSSRQAGAKSRFQSGQRRDRGRGFAGAEGEARGGAASQLGQKNPYRRQAKEERGQRAQALHGMR